MQMLRSPTALGGRKFDTKQISQTPRPNQNIKHISKNKLTGGYRKRFLGSRDIADKPNCFPDFLFVTDPPSTPRA